MRFAKHRFENTTGENIRIVNFSDTRDHLQLLLDQVVDDAEVIVNRPQTPSTFVDRLTRPAQIGLFLES